MLFMSCVCHAFASVQCYLVVTCWERADLLARVCNVYLCFVTFLCGILGQVWYLIVSISDICHLSYYYNNSNAFEIIACICKYSLKDKGLIILSGTFFFLYEQSVVMTNLNENSQSKVYFLLI